jgi:hypothetical protein
MFHELRYSIAVERWDQSEPRTGYSTQSVASHHLPNKKDSADYPSLSVFKVVTIGCIALLEFFDPLEKHRI